METLKIEKNTAKKLYPEAPEWFKNVLEETFGKKQFEKKDFTEIKTFEIACEELGIDPAKVYRDDDTDDEKAFKVLKVIVKAVNQGWVPDWNNTNQEKWYPWFRLSSGFGFVCSDYYCTTTCTTVGSRLCFETKEKSDFVATQFIEIYKTLLT